MTGSLAFPGKVVTAALAVIITLLAGMLWTGWTIYQTHATINEQEDRLMEIRGKLDHFHEVLTMSARIAAATGSPQWEEGYRTLEPQLQAVIKEAVRLTPAAYITMDDAGEMLTRTHAALGSMERQAFALVRQGHRDAAVELLAGEQYRAQKRTYAQALDLIMAGLSKQAKTHHDTQRRRAAFISVCFVAFLTVIVSTWLYVLRVATTYLHEREQAEEALQIREEQYRLLFEQSPLPMYVFEEDTLAFLAVNDAAIQHYGYSTDEFFAMTTAAIRPPEEVPRLQAYLRATKGPATPKLSQAGVWRHRKKDGTVFEAEITTARIAFSGKPVRLAIAQDITERKRMQEQAARTERLSALGQLLGGIAHEIKNPLFIVTGRLQLVKEKLANREYDTLGADLQSIEESCGRITMTTQRFLSLERPMKPQWQRCSVHEVLIQTLNFLANELMKNRIQVVRAFAPDVPQIWSEPRLLHEAFLNLILNAMQAMVAAHGEGTLTVATGRKGDLVTVRIQDDGPGISPQHHARLFEPFFSTKPPEEGTGLGLWTVRSTLNGLNGTIDCESVEGRGATFVVSVPLVSSPEHVGA